MRKEEKTEIKVENFADPKNYIEVESVEEPVESPVELEERVERPRRYALTYKAITAAMCIVNGYLTSLLIHSYNVLRIDKEDQGYFTVIMTFAFGYLLFCILKLIRELIGFRNYD